MNSRIDCRSTFCPDWFPVFCCCLLFFLGPGSRASDGAFLTREISPPAPSWLQLEPIAEDMVINGLPARVWMFTSRRKPREILNFYRGRWQGPDQVRQASLKGWVILSHVKGKRLYTVQVRQDGTFGSRGYVAISTPSSRTIGKPGTGVPMPVGSRVVQDLVMDDAGQKARMVLFVNTKTVEENGVFYQRQYSGAGWKKEMDRK